MPDHDPTTTVLALVEVCLELQCVSKHGAWVVRMLFQFAVDISVISCQGIVVYKIVILLTDDDTR
jgi:hypothetical protein